MNPTRIISKKRDGLALNEGEIAHLVSGYCDGSIPDYQMAAWAMAVFLKGMSEEETAWLTDHMIQSGSQMKWPDGAPVVDKHSTGGVGDKVSIALAPMLACCGVRVPMLSGRGLGATGGTLDKLESIPGFRTQLATDEVQGLVGKLGCVICGATEDIAPADRKLYTLRDVTATVASIPLITASIMSKKLAEGLDALVLDVKCGDGAFMKTHQDAARLARSLVQTGMRMGVETRSLITNMTQPLGAAVGNATEIIEAIELLRDDVPSEFRTLCIALGAELLVSARGITLGEATKELQHVLASGLALERFQSMVAAQGGSLNESLELANEFTVSARQHGWVQQILTEEIGWLLIELGAGRRIITDKVDHGVGMVLHAKVGTQVGPGERLATVYARHWSDELAKRFAGVFRLGDQQVETPALILDSAIDEGQ